MDPPPPASLFQRPRDEPAAFIGRAKLEGRRSLELPGHFRIVGLEFHALPSRVCETSRLHLALMPAREPNLRIQLLFDNVRDLSVPRLPAEGLEMAFFDVEDVQALGWPEVNWRVGEVVSTMPDPLTGAPPVPAFQCYAERAEVLAVAMEG